MNLRRGRVLVVAGSDSGGGAGIQADIKAITMTGGYAMTAVTAITAQNTLGVFDVHSIPLLSISKQIECVASDIGVDVVKTGMLGSIEVVEQIAQSLELECPRIPYVVDPVMIAKGGYPLLAEGAISAVRTLLVSKAYLLTPNAPEAQKLTDVCVENIDGQRRAAEELLRLGAKAVLIKGGHIEGDIVTDVLVTQTGEEIFRSSRIASKSTHGTGCTLASAIASYLAQGVELSMAVKQARDYVTKAIEHAQGFGRGHGPLNHNWILNE
jgi:hydroxymethylpyrimidine/phosphomethylpyrimidine kinase